MSDRKKILGNTVGTTLNPAMLGGGGGGEGGPSMIISASKPFATNCFWFNTSKIPPTADNTTSNATTATLGEAVVGEMILGT